MKTKILLSILFLAFLLNVFVGCSRNSGPTAVNIEPEYGSVSFLAYLNVNKALAKRAAVSDSIVLAEVITTFAGPEDTIIDRDTVTDDTPMVIRDWDSLVAGEWTLSVRSISTDGDIIHDSSQTYLVTSGQHRDITWNINPEKSRLDLRIVPDSIPDSTGVIKLFLNGVLADSGTWVPGDTLKLGSIVDVGQTYEVLIIFYSVNGSRIGQASGQVVPDATEDTKVNLSITWDDPGIQEEYGSAVVTVNLRAPSTTTIIVTSE